MNWYIPQASSLPNLKFHVFACVKKKVTQKSFKFGRNNHLPFYFVSASDGTNVVRVIPPGDCLP